MLEEDGLHCDEQIINKKPSCSKVALHKIDIDERQGIERRGDPKLWTCFVLQIDIRDAQKRAQEHQCAIHHIVRREEEEKFRKAGHILETKKKTTATCHYHRQQQVAVRQTIRVPYQEILAVACENLTALTEGY